jgi:glycine dehydrogenase
LVDRSEFQKRHIGPGLSEQRQMLNTLGLNSIEELISLTVPEKIRMREELKLSGAISEDKMREKFEKMAEMNVQMKSYIGMGYHDCHTPAVILRDVLMNPGWHTQYSPYQAEISQGRMESMLNFQTMVSDLTGTV